MAAFAPAFLPNKTIGTNATPIRVGKVETDAYTWAGCRGRSASAGPARNRFLGGLV